MSEKVQQIKDLANLLERGLLTPEEFTQQKQLVLSSAHDANSGNTPTNPTNLQEVVFYEKTFKTQDGSPIPIRVGSLTVQLYNSTFSTRNISSVSVTTLHEPGYRWFFVLLSIGSALLLLASFKYDWNTFGKIYLVALGWFVERSFNTENVYYSYCVSISGGGGESRPFVSATRDDVVEIVEAIQTAIKTRH